MSLKKSSVPLSKALSVSGAVAAGGVGGGCSLGVAGMIEKRRFGGMLEKRSLQVVVLASLVVNADLTV